MIESNDDGKKSDQIIERHLRQSRRFEDAPAAMAPGAGARFTRRVRRGRRDAATTARQQRRVVVVTSRAALKIIIPKPSS